MREKVVEKRRVEGGRALDVGELITKGVRYVL